MLLLIQIPLLLHNNELLSDSRVDRGKAFSTLEWRKREREWECREKGVEDTGQTGIKQRMEGEKKKKKKSTEMMR